MRHGSSTCSATPWTRSRTGGRSPRTRHTLRSRTLAASAFGPPAEKRTVACLTRYPQYPDRTEGSAWLYLTELQDYYSSRISYWYRCEARGGADYGDAFQFSFAPTSGGLQYLAELPDSAVWTQKSYDLSTDANGKISRKPVNMQFSFVDVVEGPGQGLGNPIGPLVDDVLVTGWKYGPVRSVAASQVGTKFRLTWAAPIQLANETADDTAHARLPCWRSPAGDNAGPR